MQLDKTLKNFHPSQARTILFYHFSPFVFLEFGGYWYRVFVRSRGLAAPETCQTVLDGGGGGGGGILDTLTRKARGSSSTLSTSRVD